MGEYANCKKKKILGLLKSLEYGYTGIMEYREMKMINWKGKD